MSTATEARAPAGPPPSGARRRAGTRPLAGAGTLLRFNLRRDRLRIPAWLAVLTLLQVGGAASYPDLYPTQADRQTQAAVMDDNPAMRVMTGPGHGLDDATFGALLSNEYLGFMLLLVALMSVLMLVRHTRTEEETGRAELVRAAVVGRHAQLTAALATVTLTNLALGLLVTFGLAGLGIESIDLPSSLVYGAAYVVVGLVFAGVAAVTTQITAYGRTAAGIAGAMIGLAYALRAIGDVAENALSWLSPIGWAQASAPYVDDNPWPLLLALAVAAGLLAAGYVLSSRRDTGAGLRAERGGRPEATPALGTPLGFAWRLQRAALMWWILVLLLFGAAYGSAVDVVEQYADNEVIQEILGDTGGTTMVEAWLSMVIALTAIIATIFVIIAALRPRREETSGRAESVLSTGLSRLRWVSTHVAIALAGGAVLLLATGVGFGVTAAAGLGDASYLWRLPAATLSYAPAVWATAGIAVTVFGLFPRAIGLAWALLGYAVFVVYFGSLLDLPHWMFNLSPYEHVARMPADPFSATPLVILTVLAAGLVVAGLAGFRRRDLETT